MNVIEVQTEQDRIDFLNLPRALYGRRHHQNTAVVRQFLEGSHPLSDTAEIRHFLLRRENRVVGRMTLTASPGLDTLFLGYFECIDAPACANALFQRAREEALRLGRTSVTGPVDVSFWVGYRLKLDQPDRVFMGEPQNLPYYPSLFEQGGFRLISQYSSHYYRAIPPDHALTRFEQRRRLMQSRGIRLIHPDFREFDRYLEDIHGLLMELYRDFPAFVPISAKNFIAMFRDLKSISDPRLIVLAYDGELPVGFFISFPDYQNDLVQGSTVVRLIHLIRTRLWPRHIVLSYSGVRHGYEGLSGALYCETLEFLKAKGLPAVSTLMQKGKVTSGFEKELIEATTHYGLYRLDLDTSR